MCFGWGRGGESETLLMENFDLHSKERKNGFAQTSKICLLESTFVYSSELQWTQKMIIVKTAPKLNLSHLLLNKHFGRQSGRQTSSLRTNIIRLWFLWACRWKTYLFIGEYNTQYWKKSSQKRRLLRKSWHSSDLELASMYATFRESMKIIDRGPTNHKTSRLKHQQITAPHSSSRPE